MGRWQTIFAALSSALTWVLVLPIRFYRFAISPALPPNTCRFYPTCSRYALDALQQHGPFKGTYLAARRLLRCHPLHPGGVDPVPTKRETFKGI
ncbi:MAG: membrane protein insertion efficiency factor YidD [Myxococcaceae bacterium]|nr:membrane protein insertion efficiency factor YidD [Myxococcaceae bacterium]